ncbi:unnamed protein product, partial [Vitis vinifera]|uniref:Uncharacterized protein n=1 Tax=Vitis vinifera TaxID=29760 RepID=D7U3G5_VITVI
MTLMVSLYISKRSRLVWDYNTSDDRSRTGTKKSKFEDTCSTMSSQSFLETKNI